MIYKEDKYVVIKQEDLKALQHIAESPLTGFIGGRFSPYITSNEKEKISSELQSLEDLLHRIGNENKYIVSNQDEPYAEVVWQVILGGEALKEDKKHDI